MNLLSSMTVNDIVLFLNIACNLGLCGIAWALNRRLTALEPAMAEQPIRRFEYARRAAV